jgi:hypothetical protein
VTKRIGWIAAVVLAVCFVLPLSTCTHYVDEKGDALEVAEGAEPPAGARAIVDQQIAAEQLVTNPLGGVLMLVAFVGPLVSALLVRRTGAGARRVLFWIQPLLLAFAAHSVYVIGGWGETTPAAWLAAAAIAALALVWLAALVTGAQAGAATG